eukprot:TRINITY_DN23184_c0_g1_i1.p1 TRINITY_DN23184_c0_g1~~TRINITY_DN23184_c0_g1_i1.p1  ORF type:complete len:1129 (-),score=202.43 TRINITY_DN23184_c0_g1_i1:81-3446(-)
MDVSLSTFGPSPVGGHGVAAAQPRWLVYCTKTLLIITDHPDFETGSAEDEVAFLGISRESGAAREGRDTHDGFRQKLVSLSGGASIQPRSCAAILGCISASQETFLLVAAEVTVAATIRQQTILEVRRCEALSFAAGDAGSEAAVALARIRDLLEQHFYCSHDFDVTRRLQQRLESNERGSVSLSSADPRFVWNQQLCQPLLSQGVSERWFTPVMQGFVQLRDLPGAPGSPSVSLLLMARRSSRHAGTRYNARGMNDGGEVANWVETEMLTRVTSTSSRGPREVWTSLTQVRGSAPVFWEQKSSTMTVSVTRGAKLAAVAFDRHNVWVADQYGQVLYVNLLSTSTSKRETEGVLSDALKEQFCLHGDVSNVHIDFHARVAGEELAFDRELNGIYNELAESVESFGFSEAEQSQATDGRLVLQRRQSGVVRTNCFDSLDRTNLLQYQIAWRWLSKYCAGNPALRVFVNATGGAYPQQRTSLGGGLFSAVGDMMGHAEDQNLQAVLRSMWADLGDVLSEQYTGAASTMSAALRQGGHTTFAMLEKGWRSVNRAYCAHFEDGARQSALDLLLGPQRLPKAQGVPEVRRAPRGKFRVAAVSWNLHGRPCWESPSAVSDLVRAATAGDAASPPEVFAFCFQEFAKLSAANVVMLGSGDTELEERFDKLALKALEEVLGEPYLQVRIVGMVGLCVAVYVAARLRGSVGAVSGDRIRSGLYGQAGNKGAVAVSFKLEESSICLMSLHLESGASSKKAAERLEQLREVLQSCSQSASQGSKQSTLIKYDLLVLGGDFNFRTTFPDQASPHALRTTLASGWTDTSEIGLVGHGEGVSSTSDDVARLFRECDELQGSQGRSRTGLQELLTQFSMTEGPVHFPPTYRLVEGAPEYDSERDPAWCDRFLYPRVGVSRRRYAALGGLQQSDHRPVCVDLEVTLLAMPTGGQAVPAAQAAATSMDLLGSAEGSQEAFASSSPSTQSSPQEQSSSASQLDLLDFGDAGDTQTTAKALPGWAPPAGNLAVGRLVYAEFQGGWYLARVTRSAGGTVDVSWLRPQGAEWGNSEEMAHYLCSTNADETMHGDMLPLATKIRLPDSEELRKRRGVHQSAMPPSSAAQATSQGSAGAIDLLG